MKDEPISVIVRSIADYARGPGNQAQIGIVESAAPDPFKVSIGGLVFDYRRLRCVTGAIDGLFPGDKVFMLPIENEFLILGKIEVVWP